MVRVKWESKELFFFSLFTFFLEKLVKRKMFIFLLRRTSRRLHRSFSAAAALPTPTSSNLHTKYEFTPPPSLHKNPKPQTHTNSNKTHKKKEKPPYRPPSSLDRSGKKPVKSDLPFDFRFSYTESSNTVRPIGLREPKYSPFGPERVDRVWTGVCAPAADPKAGKEEAEKLEEKREKIRERIQGNELTNAERIAIVERYSKHKTKRQINLGRDGLTHNMLNDIHNNWKHAEAVRIKCMGVPTVDMKNVCMQLEDKTFGKIIYRHGGSLVLYRGRNYNPKKRPVIPLMLWKPHEPIYPKLIKTTIDGLSIEETKEMRKKGLAVPALTKLAKNGYYGGLLPMVRDAFLVAELVRIDCRGLEKKDYKKIGCKLRDLIPCILVTFEKEQIVVWKGKDYKPNEGGYFRMEREPFDNSCSDSADDAGSGQEPADDRHRQIAFGSSKEEVGSFLTTKLEAETL